MHVLCSGIQMHSWLLTTTQKDTDIFFAPVLFAPSVHTMFCVKVKKSQFLPSDMNLFTALVCTQMSAFVPNEFICILQQKAQSARIALLWIQQAAPEKPLHCGPFWTSQLISHFAWTSNCQHCSHMCVEPVTHNTCDFNHFFVQNCP